MTPGADFGDGEGDQDGGEDEGDEAEGDIDEDLAAELDMALGDEADEENEGDDEEEEDEDESDEDDEDDEDDEAVQAKKLLNEEIRDLEAAVAKKKQEIASSANPLIRVHSRLLSCVTLIANQEYTASLRRCPAQAASRPRHKARPAGRDEGEATLGERGRRKRRGGIRRR